VAGEVAAVALEGVEISVGFFDGGTDDLRNVPLLRFEHCEMGVDCAQKDCEGEEGCAAHCWLFVLSVGVVCPSKMGVKKGC